MTSVRVTETKQEWRMAPPDFEPSGLVFIHYPGYWSGDLLLLCDVAYDVHTREEVSVTPVRRDSLKLYKP